MLNLGGVDLILPDREGRIEQWIKDNIPTSSYKPWLRDTWPGFGTAGIAYPLGHRPEPEFRLNRFRWPHGARRWAYGHFLASSDQVGRVQDLACGADGSYSQVPFAFGTAETGESVSTSVYVLPPTPLSGIRGLTGAAQSLYLLTLVDQRYYWWWSNFGNFTVTSGTQWSDLYNNVKSILGISLTWDSIDSAYLQPSSAFNLPYEPTPVIFDAIADNVGQRIVCNYDGSVYAQNYQSAYQAMTADFAAHPGRILAAGGFRFANPL